MLPSDADAVALAEKEIFPVPWSEEDISKTLSSEGAMCYTALVDGKLAAYIIGRIIPPEAEIYRIATLPNYRRRKIAYRLMDYTVKSERKNGLESLFLEVRKSNLPAQALYRSYGFKEIGLRKKYYKDPPDDALVMMLSPSVEIED